MDYKDATLEFVDKASTVKPVRQLFAEARTLDTITANINNFFVHSDSDNYVPGMSTYLTDSFAWEDFGANTTQIKNFTLVELDQGTYQGKTLVLTKRYDGGSLEYLVRVRVIDSDNDYVGPKAANSPSDPVETGNYYWVKIIDLFSVNAKSADIAKYFNEEFYGSKEAAAKSKQDTQVVDKAGWRTKANETIFKSQDSSRIYIVIDTGEERIQDNGEFNDLKLLAKDTAANLIVTEYDLVLSKQRIQDLASTSMSIADQIIENRPNSTLKFLVFLPTAVLRPLLSAQDSNFSQSVSLSLFDYKNQIMQINIFLKALDSKVKELKIPLDLKKEGDRVQAAQIAITNYLNKWYAKYLYKEGYDLILSFNEEGALSSIIVAGPDGLEKKPVELSQDYLLHPKWDKNSEKFSNPRTSHYLANIPSMLQDKEKVGQPTGLTWLKYVQTYTLNMPDYKAAKKENPPTKKQRAEYVLQTTKDELKGVTTSNNLEMVITRLSPEIRAITAQAKKQMFQKFQDSNMSKITSKNFTIYDIDSLFTDVLDRVSIDTLLTTVKLAQNPDRAKKHFKEKFIAYDIDAQVKKINKTKEEFKRQIDSQKKQEDTGQNPYNDDIKIKSVAKSAAKEAVDHLSALAQEALIQTVKNLLQSLINTLNEEDEKTKSQDYGVIDIEENVSPQELTETMNTINSLRGVDFELPDLKIILKIISENTTPLEMLAIFEGEGNMAVITLLNRLFKKKFSLLETILPTLYDVEDFLITLGQNLKTPITSATAQIQIEKTKESPILDFCSPDEQIILDHLATRFPDQLASEQLQKSATNHTALLSVLDELQANIDGFSGLLGNDNIDAILDSIQDNPATKYNMGQVIEAYFNPISKMFTFEALNAGESLIETLAIPNPDYDATELDGLLEGKSDQEQRDIASQYLASRPPGTKEEIILPLRELRTLLSNPSTSVYTNLTDRLEGEYNEKSDMMIDNFTVVLPLDAFSLPVTDINALNAYHKGKLENYMELKFFGIQPPPTYEDAVQLAGATQGKEAGKGAMPQADAEKAITTKLNDMLQEYEETYRNVRTSFKVVLNGVAIIETDSTIVTPLLEDPKINMGELINPKDLGKLPQSSAMATWIDGVFKKYNAKYTNQDNTPAFDMGIYSKGLGQGSVPYEDWMDEFAKSWLFPYMNRQLLYRLSKQVSQSDFFKPEVLKKLRLTAPNDFFTSAKGKQISAENVNELISLRQIKPEVNDKEKLFRLYEKESAEILFDRTPLENALAMEAVETFVKIYLIEYLLSTIVIQGEIDTTKINQKLDNLEPIIGLMVENMKSFGKETEYLLTQLLSQYSSFRQEFSGRSSKVLPLPENFNTYDDELQNILAVLINEQYDEVHKDFVAMTNLFDPSSSDVKVETKEFLDIIPNIDVAESSASSRNRLLKPVDDLLKETANFGGFMLERYIKIEGAPKSFEQAATQAEVELHKMMVLDPLEACIALVEDIRNPGKFLPVRRSQVYPNQPNIYNQLQRSQLWFDTYNDKYAEYSKNYAATKADMDNAGSKYSMDNAVVAHHKVKNDWSNWKEAYLEQWQDGELTQGFNDEINKSAQFPGIQNFYYDKGNLLGIVRRSSFKELIENIKDYNVSLLGPLENTLNAAYTAQFELNALRGIKTTAHSAYLKAAQQASGWFLKYTEKFKEPFDTSSLGYFNISENENYVFEEDSWSMSSAAGEENLYKINTFFALFDCNANKNSDGYDLLQQAMASWTLDMFIGSINDIQDLDWRKDAPSKMFNELATQQEWDEFLIFLLNYNNQSGLLDPFVQAFEVLIDPAGADPKLLDLIAGQTVTTNGDGLSLIEEHNNYNFTLTDADMQKFINDSGYDTLPYLKAFNDLSSLIDTMYTGLTDLTVTINTTMSDESKDKANARIQEWQERSAYHSQPTIKSGEKVAGVEYEDMSFFNVKQAYENAYNAYIEASSDYTEKYYKFKSTPLGQNATDAKVEELLADLISDTQYQIKNAAIINKPYSEYIGSIKYGVRLVYKLPSQKVFSDPTGKGQLELATHVKSKSLDPFEGRAAPFSHPVNYVGKSFVMKEVDIKSNQVIEDLEKYITDLWATPFKNLDDSKSYLTPQEDTFLTIPLIEIEKEVKDYFAENNIPVPKGQEAPLLGDAILENFPTTYLKNTLRNSHELKVLLTEMMLYDELVTLVGTWTSAYAMKSTFSGTNAGLFSGTKQYLEGALKGLVIQREIEHSNVNKTPSQTATEQYASLSNTTGDTNSDFGPLKDLVGYAAIFAVKFPLKVLKGHVLASDPAIITAKKIQDAIVAAMKAGASAINTAANLAGGDAPDLSGAVEFASTDSALIPITLALFPFPIGLNFALPITPAGMAFLGTAALADAL